VIQTVLCVVWYSITCNVVLGSAVCNVILTVLSVVWYKQCCLWCDTDSAVCYVIQTVLSVLWYSVTCNIVLGSAVCNVILTVLSVVWHKQCCLKCDIDSAVCCVIQCHMCCSNRECCLTTLKLIGLRPRLHVSHVILYHITDSTVIQTVLCVVWYRQCCLLCAIDSAVYCVIQTVLCVVWYWQCCLLCDTDSAVCCVILTVLSVMWYSITCDTCNRGRRERWGAGVEYHFWRNFMSPTPRRKWYLTTGRRFH